MKIARKDGLTDFSKLAPRNTIITLEEPFKPSEIADNNSFCLSRIQLAKFLRKTQKKKLRKNNMQLRQGGKISRGKVSPKMRVA